MIEEFTIQNYRSIWESTTLPVDDRISILIGANEAGKSNVLKSISKFQNERPLVPNELSNVHQYDPNSYDDVELLTTTLSEEAKSQIKWLNKPYVTSDLIDIPPTRDTTDDEFDELKAGPLLEQAKVQIVRYASGDHLLSFTPSSGDWGHREQDLLEEYPMPLEDFLEKRENDLITLGRKFLHDVQENPRLSEILGDDFPVSTPADVRESLERVEHQFRDQNDGNIPSDEDIYSGSEGEISAGPATIEVASQASTLRTTLAEVTSESNPLGSLPVIIDQMEISLARPKYDILEDRQSPVLHGLFRLGSIALDSYNSFESDQLKDDLEYACDELERYLNAFWAFDYSRREGIDELPAVSDAPYSVSYNLTSTTVELRLGEGDEEPVPLDQRSDGMRWILTFLLSVLAEGNATDKRGIILLDDPGIHLHPEAEKKLYRALYYVVPEAQIIYSTHSPVLVDQRNPQQLRIVKYSGETGTSVTTDLGSARDEESQIDLLSTARDALGWTLSDSLFGGKKTILVEGQSDKLYLEVFNQFFSFQEDREHLDEQVRFVVGGGDRIAFLSRILNAEEVEHVLLLDDDKASQEFDDWMEDRTLYYRDIEWEDLEVDYPIEVEDLIETELLVSSLNDIVGGILDESLILQRADVTEQPIMDILDDELDDEDLDIDAFKKELSTNITSTLRTALREGDREYEETEQRFERVINKLSSELSEG
ncbi:AAA domain-containing protein, putative AbiEii toxin, Type IV TA system [Halomicrobium zhouii]|uniref:AAA domain-containing protein, putative AbiEii toxin, Type IV TA system n=1 Tax=Halomicrobium zhouii TaxID=767519 RepID=A0A1I6K938_9EURY|nr:AAA family ATPase [Halomicrobium zhouii]SFR87751.1 AAA domain-containing protein, putative AbiEii toxin, Type IV TA system [Halomicrobium zhouii]